MAYPGSHGRFSMYHNTSPSLLPNDVYIPLGQRIGNNRKTGEAILAIHLYSVLKTSFSSRMFPSLKLRLRVGFPGRMLWERSSISLRWIHSVWLRLLMGVKWAQIWKSHLKITPEPCQLEISWLFKPKLVSWITVVDVYNYFLCSHCTQAKCDVSDQFHSLTCGQGTLRSRYNY